MEKVTLVRPIFKSKRILRTARVSAFLLVVVLAFGLFAGCSKKTDEANRLTVVINENVVTAPLIGIAREKGYFKEQGLKIDAITFDSGSSGAIESLDVGKLDILPTGIIPSLSYAAQGSGIKVIGGTASGGNYIIAKPELAAKLRNDPDFEQWKGKRLGLVRLSTSQMVTRYSLGKRGFDMNKDVTFVEIDTYPNIIEGVRKGEVDIGYVDTSYLQRLAEQGLEIAYPMTYLLSDYVCCRINVSANAYKNKRPALVKFLKSLILAYKDYTEDQDGTVKLLAAASRQTEQYAYNILYNPDTSADRKFNPEPNFNGTRNVYETLLQLGYTKNIGVPIEDIVDVSIFKDALDEILGEYPNEQAYLKLKADFEANN